VTLVLSLGGVSVCARCALGALLLCGQSATSVRPKPLQVSQPTSGQPSCLEPPPQLSPQVSLLSSIPPCAPYHQIRVHLIELPGWGFSPMPGVLQHCRDPEAIVNLHVEVVEGWLTSAPAAFPAMATAARVLLGHSYGGMFLSVCASTGAWTSAV
jgi:hypothetical protein